MATSLIWLVDPDVGMMQAGSAGMASSITLSASSSAAEKWNHQRQPQFVLQRVYKLRVLFIRDHSHRIELAQRFTKYAMTKPFVCDTRERYCRQARPQTGPKHGGEINGIFDEQDNMRAPAHAQCTQPKPLAIRPERRQSSRYETARPLP
jgi:hypothetical protein